MSDFKAIFGIENQEVRKTCILMPFIGKGMLSAFGIATLSRGMLYAGASNKDFTVIVTGIGAPLVGDAVLYLGESGCRKVILFGSCGLVSADNGLSLGSVVCPSRAYAQESFSDMLGNRKVSSRVYYPHKPLLRKFLAGAKRYGVKEVSCVSVGSLKLEESWRPIFIANAITALDMECSAFFSASAALRLQALALFYVSDIIGKKPFYVHMQSSEKAHVALARREAAGLLCGFIKKNISA